MSTSDTMHARTHTHPHSQLIAKSSSLCNHICTTAINQLQAKAHYEKEVCLRLSCTDNKQQHTQTQPHKQPAFEDEETFGEESGYAERVQGTLRPILTRLCIDCEDRSLWHKVQKDLLKVYRSSSSAAVRLAAMTIVKALYEEVGQEFAAACVPEALQTVAESLDDDDYSVNKLAVSLVKLMSQLTGEDVSAYMK